MAGAIYRRRILVCSFLVASRRPTTYNNVPTIGLTILYMQRTIKIKLKDNESLIETIRLYSEIYKYICDFGFKKKTWNQVELHKLTYKKIRKKYPKFPSALVQTVRNVASETLKRTKLKNKINTKKFSSARFDKRTLRVSLEHNIISISSINGRQKFEFRENRFTKKYKDWTPTAGTLSYRKKGQLFLNLVVEKEKPRQLSFSEKDILGIDRGVNNILVCSNNQFFNSKRLKKVKGKYQYLKSVLQSKGTPSARRKLKELSGRERRFVSDTNHCLSKIVANSGFKVFALENLKRMTNKKNGKKFNKKLGGWSFKQFEMFLRYKAEVLGKLVMLVNPKYTSQKCSTCGHTERANRKGSVFKCKKCSFELHSDLNASRNIANLGKSVISGLFVNQPNVTSVMDSYKPTNLLVGS